MSVERERKRQPLALAAIDGRRSAGLVEKDGGVFRSLVAKLGAPRLLKELPLGLRKTGAQVPGLGQLEPVDGGGNFELARLDLEARFGGNDIEPSVTVKSRAQTPGRVGSRALCLRLRHLLRRTERVPEAEEPGGEKPADGHEHQQDRQHEGTTTRRCLRIDNTRSSGSGAHGLIVTLRRARVVKKWSRGR